MDLWIKIASALALLAMLGFLLPRAKQVWAESPKAEKGDWGAVIIPMAMVVGLVVVLILAV